MRRHPYKQVTWLAIQMLTTCWRVIRSNLLSLIKFSRLYLLMYANWISHFHSILWILSRLCIPLCVSMYSSRQHLLFKGQNIKHHSSAPTSPSPSFSKQQGRRNVQARPRSGSIFQTNKVEAIPSNNFKCLTINYTRNIWFSFIDTLYYYGII